MGVRITMANNKYKDDKLPKKKTCSQFNPLVRIRHKILVRNGRSNI